MLSIIRRKYGRSSSLLNSLAEYYKLDEASGVRVGSHAGLTLTDNNTVGSAVGKIGNAASFVAASSEYLSRASSAPLQISGGDFTMSFWFKAASLTADFMYVVGKETEYVVYVWGAGFDLVNFQVGDGSSIIGNILTPISSIVVGNWYHVLAWVEGGTAYLRLNGAAPIAGALTGPQGVGANPFHIGIRPGILDRAYDGLFDECALWNRALTSPEQSQLINGGAGVTYPAFA